MVLVYFFQYFGIAFKIRLKTNLCRVCGKVGIGKYIIWFLCFHYKPPLLDLTLG